MENCLVTKLKSVVNNDNLVYFDAFEITIGFGEDQSAPISRFAVASPADFILGGFGVVYKAIDNCHICNGNGVTIEDENGEFQYPDTMLNYSVLINPIDISKPVTFLVIGLNNVKSLNLPTILSYRYMKQPYLDRIKFVDFGDITSLPVWYLPPVDGVHPTTDLAYLKDMNVSNPANITSLSMGARSIKILTSYIKKYINLTSLPTASLIGSLDDLVNFTALTQFVADNNNNVSGSLASIGNCRNMGKIHIYGTNVTGDIVDYVAVRVAAGDTSGVLKELNANNKLTFNGTPIPPGHHSITWTGAGAENITVGDEYIP